MATNNEDLAPPADRDSYIAALERSNRELDYFVSSVAHDLNAPLRAVLGYCEVLQQRVGGRLNESEREFLESAIAATQRMHNLINTSRQFARLNGDGEFKEIVDFDLAVEAVLDNLHPWIEESEATITHGPLPQVVGDESQLVRLLQNLICNSIKYRGRQNPRIHIHAEAAGEHWVFQVRDNGIGIAPQDHDRVFLLFQRLGDDSTGGGDGLGLAICKKIVQRHGGRIWVESQTGQGSRFCFSLPRA